MCLQQLDERNHVYMRQMILFVARRHLDVMAFRMCMMVSGIIYAFVRTTIEHCSCIDIIANASALAYV